MAELLLADGDTSFNTSLMFLRLCPFWSSQLSESRALHSIRGLRNADR